MHLDEKFHILTILSILRSESLTLQQRATLIDQSQFQTTAIGRNVLQRGHNVSLTPRIIVYTGGKNCSRYNCSILLPC
jgi:hypothetical protein